MNNVFEFFADQDRVKMLWQFIVNTLKGSSKLLVTIPSLHESLDPLGVSYANPAVLFTNCPYMIFNVYCAKIINYSLLV